MPPRQQKADEAPPAEPPEQAAQELTIEQRVEQAQLAADAANARHVALVEEFAEIIGKLSERVADLEKGVPPAEPGVAQEANPLLERRIASLEQQVNGTLTRDAPVATRDLCDDCGAPMDGQHFDDCRHLPNPEPKGPRATQARVGAVSDRG